MQPNDPEAVEAAERVRAACLDAAREAWEQARLAGLCADGAWEVAVGAMRSVDLAALVAETRTASRSPR